MATAQQDPNQQGFTVANSMDPDAFAAGMPDKFVGTIISVHAYPQVQKNGTRYYGYVGVRIRPEPESGFDEFTQSYFANGLNKGYPSKDGKTPAGGTHDAYQALGAGKISLDANDGPCLDANFHVNPDHPNVGVYWMGTFAKKMSWEQFCEALRDCDTKGIVDKGNPRLDFCAGVKCRFDRVPQKQDEDAKPKPKKEGEKDQEFRTLVPTELISVGNAVTGGTNASSNAAPSGANGAGNLDELIVAEILTQLKATPQGLTVGNLMQSVPKAMIVAGQMDKKQKGYVMGWIGERNKDNNLPINLVDIDDTTYDPAKDTLSAD
jgi:hypothetical protein